MFAFFHISGTTNVQTLQSSMLQSDTTAEYHGEERLNGPQRILTEMLRNKINRVLVGNKEHETDNSQTQNKIDK